MSTDVLAAERGTISELGRQMVELGLTRGTGGNLSQRGEGGRIAVSPTRVPYSEIAAEDVPVVTLDGEQVAGEYPPSSESPMHRMIYQHREDVGGVVHTHSPFASTFATLGTEIPPSHYLIAMAGKKVPVAGFAQPGTEELGRLALEALGDDHHACLLKHHGVMALGADAEQALETAQMVEFCARIHFQAMAVGEPPNLDEEALETLIEGFDEYRDLI
jgi:L-fuculose-phosphate aldolase